MHNQLSIPKLMSGGVIPSYRCSSTCKHCLYGSSPEWPKDYIDTAASETVCKVLKMKGCSSVHIGGGEPFLNRDGLLDMLEVFQNKGISVEYIETNSSWHKSYQDAIPFLMELRTLGVRTLLVSMSPYHNEFIPFNKVHKVITDCDSAGIQVFPWIQDFYSECGSFDDQKTHSLDEYGARFGDDYIKEIPKRYWVHPGGRALYNTVSSEPEKSIDKLFSETTCAHELRSTSHFHIDLYGNYVPGLCAGFAIEMEDLAEPLDPDKYPLLTRLFAGGISELLTYVQTYYKYKPSDTYISKCHLCNDVRLYLTMNYRDEFQELQPHQYYRELAELDDRYE